MKVVNIPTEKIEPNNYNPNVMTDEEFKECLEEVRHLGTVPKPIIVRPAGEMFIIIDGEHNWKAAKELGIKELPCEVLQADLLESMRQTYKRNQHGTFNKIKLGKMFQEALDESKLSNRKIAEQFGLSEATIRNYLLYWNAWQVRKDFGGEDCYQEGINKLNITQIRMYIKLPPIIRDVWLERCEADIRAIMLDAYSDLYRSFESEKEMLDYCKNDPNFGNYSDEVDYETYQKIYDCGLAEFVQKDCARGIESFRQSIKKALDLIKWENEYCKLLNLPREKIREYTKYYIDAADRWEGKGFMEEIFKVIYGQDKFLITPEELNEILNAKCDEEKERTLDYIINKIHLLLIEKGYSTASENLRNKPDPIEELTKKLIEEKAPQYLKDAKINVLAKKFILELECDKFEKPEMESEERQEDFKKGLVEIFSHKLHQFVYNFDEGKAQKETQEALRKFVAFYKSQTIEEKLKREKNLLKTISDNFSISEDKFKQFSEEEIEKIRIASILYMELEKRRKAWKEMIENIKQYRH